MKTLCTPVSKEDIAQLKVGDMVYLSGKIFCGRDAVLPKVVALAESGTTAEKGIELEGSLVFHTAVSDAGVGPTSSNKVEIEGSIAPLSKYGVRIHLGKGKVAMLAMSSAATLTPLSPLAIATSLAIT